MLKHDPERNQPDPLRPAGYAALRQQFRLDTVPHWRQSFVATSGTRRLDRAGGAVTEVFPPQYWPGDGFAAHLEFALKYDGINLTFLASLFAAVDPALVGDYVQSKPYGKYARRLWYLYELLTDVRLPLADLTRGNYVLLLDPEKYYVAPVRLVGRQRIKDNLLGDGRFCPIVRRTDTLLAYEEADLAERCRRAIAPYPPEVFRRALGYLYTKETKSSFAIEQVALSSGRTERFVRELQRAASEDFCRMDRLIELQNGIVDSRFAERDIRATQNYVGESVVWRGERVHYVCPKPEDLPRLLDGLQAVHRRMADGSVAPVIHAAVIAFGFVFLHPFTDGNGRIHRFLIHNILARRGFAPAGVVFPVSAAMLKRPAEYDRCLEAFSRPLLSLVDYSLDEDGRLTVHNDTRALYRTPDLTPQAEALFRFVEETIDTDLIAELTFLDRYDKVRGAIRDIVDLPDRLLDLFVRFCLQNNGKLSRRKRAQYFAALSEAEVAALENVVGTVFFAEAVE